MILSDIIVMLPNSVCRMNLESVRDFFHSIACCTKSLVCKKPKGFTVSLRDCSFSALSSLLVDKANLFVSTSEEYPLGNNSPIKTGSDPDCTWVEETRFSASCEVMAILHSFERNALNMANGSGRRPCLFLCA